VVASIRPSSKAQPLKSSNAVLESAECFRCGIQGEPLYRSDPFGVVRCPKCSQVFISPRLAAADRGRIYHDPDYFQVGVYGLSKRFNPGRRAKEIWDAGRLQLIARHRDEARRPGRLLEIGCAYGFFLLAAQRLGFEATGIEYSRSAAERARGATGLEIRQGAIDDVPLPDEHFDVVCFWDVIEHVEDPLVFMRKLARATRRNGVIAFSCPNFASWPAGILRARWWTLRPEQHIWQFTPATIRQLMRDVGLQEIAIVTDPFSRANLCRTDSLIVLARKQQRGATDA
jgi:SAM-dependent methyltransferase